MKLIPLSLLQTAARDQHGDLTPPTAASVTSFLPLNSYAHASNHMVRPVESNNLFTTSRSGFCYGEAGPSSIKDLYSKLLQTLNQDIAFPQEELSDMHQIPADPLISDAMTGEATHTKAAFPESTSNQFNNQELRGGISDLINVSCGDDRSLCYAINKRQDQLSMDGDWDKLSTKSVLNFVKSFKYNLSGIEVKTPEFIEAFNYLVQEIDKYKQSNQVYMKLKSVVKWLIFINISVSEELKLTEPINSHELLYWLLQDSLLLKKLCLEGVQEESRLKTFGEVWNILLPKIAIARVKFQQEAPEYSLSIIKYWYQDHHPEIWNSISKLNHGSSPEKNIMHVVLNKALHEGIMVDPRSDGFFQKVNSADELRVPKLEIFPHSMKPQRFVVASKSIDSTEEKDIKNTFNKLIVINDPSHIKNRNQIKIAGLPLINFYEHNIHTTHSKTKKDMIYRARIMIEMKHKCHYERHLETRLNFLLWHLKMCHKHLVSLQMSEGIVVSHNAEIEFYQWLKMILFEQEENELPIFGDVKIEQVYLAQHIKYGPAQKFLINEYLGAENAYEKVIQVSLALIFYWDQKSHIHGFFQSEQEYWKKMIETLGVMLELRSVYSLSRFTANGDFIDH
jgi:hypothetical protein